MGQKFAAYDAQGNITAYYDSVDSPIPSGVTDVLAITDEQWQSCLSTAGYTVNSGAWSRRQRRLPRSFLPLRTRRKSPR